MQPPKSSICVICGILPATTTEHVPPRGFFKGTTGQFRTVPACNICNNGSSDDDETLRNYISLQIGKQTIGAKFLWEKGAHKSFLRSDSQRSQLLNTLHEETIENKGGSATNRFSFEVDVCLYQRVFERITRGLYFWHNQTIFPIDIPIQINLYNQQPDLSLSGMEMFEKYTVVENAFEYWIVTDSENPCNSLWLFNFHRSHWVGAKTGVF